MSKLLNRAATKKFILDRYKALRAGPQMTRVSKETLDTYEAKLRNMIDNDIMSHPSIGKTFKP
jgi:hypothetical protein